MEDDVALPTVVINDGRLLPWALADLGCDTRWLQEQLSSHGAASPAEVFLLSVDDTGSVLFIAKEEAT